MASLPDARPPLSQRTFSSPLLEARLQAAVGRIRDPDLAILLANCWPNTLDTTVFSHDPDPWNPSTWVITGDIPAMWLRDSSNQLLPYLTLLSTSSRQDPDWTALYRLVLGCLLAQAKCVLLHPFSNAFIPPTSSASPGTDDWVHPPLPETKKGDVGVFESKWEVDSVASFLDLAGKLSESSGRADFARNEEWRSAVRLVLQICRMQQRGTDEEVALLGVPWWGPGQSPVDSRGEQPSGRGTGKYDGGKGVYRFQRESRLASETRALGGLGEPARRCGLVKSAFRPSDDATLYPFLVPSNAFLSVALLKLADVLDPEGKLVGSSESLLNEVATLSQECRALGDEVMAAVWTHGVVTVPTGEGKSERVFAYEVDGFGSFSIADDANVPSLLSLPYFEFLSSKDPVYLTTRRFVLSSRNKWYFKGTHGEGIGGMHIGSGFVWPMSLCMRALTSDDDEEILDCLKLLKTTTAGAGLMHESFHVDDPNNFTRSHFGWVNGLFGQLVLHLLETRPYLL